MQIFDYQLFTGYFIYKLNKSKNSSILCILEYTSYT